MDRARARQLARAARLGVILSACNAPGAIVNLYGSTDKGEHGYMPFYRSHLADRRFRRNVVFEIGVGGWESRSAGGSLAVWRDYLPRSTIVGIDLYPKIIRWGRRVKFELADQNDPSQLSAVVGKYGRPDVVIDDGSHVGEHVVSSFNRLWPALRPGGLYVIEDLSTSYCEPWGGQYPPPATSGVGLAMSAVDDVQAQDRTFQIHPEFGTRPSPRHPSVSAVHTYPGIVFLRKSEQDKV